MRQEDNTGNTSRLVVGAASLGTQSKLSRAMAAVTASWNSSIIHFTKGVLQLLNLLLFDKASKRC